MSFTKGVKGSDVYASTDNAVLDLSVMLNRGLEARKITAALTDIFTHGTAEDRVDAFVLAYQTRDVRGGKGERELFYNMFGDLLNLEPHATKATFPLISEYGCWRDIFKLFPHAPADFTTLVINQLKKDAATPPEQPISLLAKHAPREHCLKDKPLVTTLAKALFPGSDKIQMMYRKQLSALNKRLNTVEIAMCSRNFASIKPATVPGRALKLYTKGFLNQVVKGKYGRKVPSDELDRITCAQTFKDHFDLAKQGKAKVNGADTVYPHELVAKVLSDDFDKDAVEAQWLSIVNPIKALGTLSRTLAMCDFSGSMAGDPMNVSMALGLIIAECNTGIFKDTILTFDSTPTLHKFKSKGFIDRVNEVRHLAQGTSTDFQAAYNLVLQTMKDNRVPAGMEPKDLIVLTDMGWDAACGYGHYGYSYHVHAVKTKPEESHPQIARRAFKLTSQLLFGDVSPGWEPPRIVIWNLRAEYKDFHASATEVGVLQVAGWSPSLLKVLMKNGADALTPTAMLRAQLDDERYDAVRAAVKPFLLLASNSNAESLSEPMQSKPLTAQNLVMTRSESGTLLVSQTYSDHDASCTLAEPCYTCTEGEEFRIAHQDYACEEDCDCTERWAKAKKAALAVSCVLPTSDDES
jgi:hypothetical protein